MFRILSIYNFVTDTWTSVGNFLFMRTMFTAIYLPNKVRPKVCGQSTYIHTYIIKCPGNEGSKSSQFFRTI